MKLIYLLKLDYPAQYSKYKNSDYDYLAAHWAEQFQEYSYEQVYKALNAAISAKRGDFPPSIGEIKERLIDITDPDVSSFDATWDRLLKCFQRGSVHAQDDWERLPEADRELITPGEIYRISTSEDCNLTVEKAGYYSRWKAQQERKRIDKAVPLPIRDIMKQARENALEMQKQEAALIEDSRPIEMRDVWNDPLRNPEPGMTIAELLAKKKAEMEAKQGGLEANEAE